MSGIFLFEKKIFRKVFVISCLLGFSYAAKAQYQLQSPDGKVTVSINASNGINYSVSLNSALFIQNATANITCNHITIDKKTKVKNVAETAENSVVHPIVPLKEKTIKNNYKQLSIAFSNNISVEFRAFDNGVAYRFVTNIDDSVEVNESANLAFADDFNFWGGFMDGFMGPQEVDFYKMKIADFPASKNAFLPTLFEHSKGYKLLFTEADIVDYPHMFLNKSQFKNTLQGVFPAFPLETELIKDRNSNVIKTAPYIAKTTGKRTYPWRLMVITENDAQLVEANLVYLLARDCELKQTDWIKPGKVSWDWWNDLNLYGVDFTSGVNTATYKYYIDFAARNGLEYIIMDEGWSVSSLDISKPAKNLDLAEVIRYGKGKNVGVILWASWRAVESNMAVLGLYNQWGVAGIKVDFMDRADQWMVNFYERIAREAANNHLLVDFHGAFKPNGLHRTYPNVLTYEGVKGMENCKWSADITPEHDAVLPFIRMAAGPMDYTPGAMRNFHHNEYKHNFSRPGSIGTRCHQLALFVVYESGLQMLADSPSNYEREQESTDFISKTPNTWDETKVLEAKVGEYIVLARRKGDSWYIGAITDQTPREFTIDLSFLSDGDHRTVIMQDGLNVTKFAEDYKRIETSFNKQSKLTVKLAKGGGFVARIE